MTKITFTGEAFNAMSLGQLDALKRIVSNEKIEQITVQNGGLGLPEGYLAFIQVYTSEGTIYGGISPQGDVST